MTSVSIIICTRDHPEELRRCLASLVPSRHQVLEILVVDNGSGGIDIRELVESGGARYVRQPVAGLSATRNLGIASARGDVLAFTDDDCEMHPGWVAAIRAGFENPSVGCVVGKATAPPGANRVQSEYEQYSRRFPTSIVEITREAVGDFYFRAGIGVGANMAIRRRVLQELGGFPESLKDSGDDLYIFNRVLFAGLKVQYRPDSVVYQHHRATVGKQLRRFYEYGVGIPLWLHELCRRHGTPYILFGNVCWFCVRTSLGGLRRLVRGKGIQGLFAFVQIAGIVAGLLHLVLPKQRLGGASGPK